MTQLSNEALMAASAIPVDYFLIVSALVFTIGTVGVFLNAGNVIVVLMSIELMLLAVNINFVAFSQNLQDLIGQIFSIFVLTVAAAEAAIGLAILVVYFRNQRSINMLQQQVLKG